MDTLYWNEILRSKEEKRILTGNIMGIEEEYYKLQNKNIVCAIVWYGDIKVLIPITHMNINNNSKSTIRGMLGAQIDFIVVEVDNVSNLAIASRKLAMELRSKLELPKLQKNDVVKTRIVAISRKYIIVDFYGKELKIKAEDLKHTFIVNCKDEYKVGDNLLVRIKSIDIQNNIFEISAKELTENPFKNIRKFITEGAEYIGTVIAFPQNNSGIIVQLDVLKVTSLCRVPANFNNYPHLLDKVLIKITEIKEDKKYIYSILKRII